MLEKPDDLDLTTSFRPWWQRPAGASLLALATLTTLAFTFFLSPISWLKGETDLLGNYTFLKEHQQAADAQQGMERVHAQLFPAWLIELANTPQPQRAHAQTFQPLREAVEHDPLLVGILDKIHAILIAENLTQKDGDLLQLRWAWNQRLTELDEPFYLQADLVSQNNSTFWLAESYRKLARTTLTAADIPADILIVKRIDSTNSYETYTGLAHAGATEAIVLVDRTFDAVVDDLWPLLDGQPTNNPPTNTQQTIQAIMLDAVLAEFHQHLQPQHLQRLIDTAPLRRELAEISHNLTNRKNCKNPIRLPNAPWNGHNPLTLDQLDAFAKHDRLQSCPRATRQEADRLRQISRTLKTDPILQQALESLLALLTRATAIHEARHIADDQLTNGLEAPLDCTLCPDSMTTTARAELSAYLASFAWSNAPHTSLFLACINNAAGGSRPHRQALGTALRHLETLCDQPPPPDLSTRAQNLEKNLFNRHQPITLPPDYPTSVSIQ